MNVNGFLAQKKEALLAQVLESAGYAWRTWGWIEPADRKASRRGADLGWRADTCWNNLADVLQRHCDCVKLTCQCRTNSRCHHKEYVRLHSVLNVSLIIVPCPSCSDNDKNANMWISYRVQLPMEVSAEFKQKNTKEWRTLPDVL